MTAMSCRHFVAHSAKEGPSKSVPMLSSLLSMNMYACCVAHHAEG